MGLGYVAAMGGRVVATFDIQRASLPLVWEDGCYPENIRKLRGRAKDVGRILRKFYRDNAAAPDATAENAHAQGLSLRINTDLARAIAGLKEHHKQSWVCPELELVWAEMQRRGEVGE
jgi:hypothetical protein